MQRSSRSNVRVPEDNTAAESCRGSQGKTPSLLDLSCSGPHGGGGGLKTNEIVGVDWRDMLANLVPRSPPFSLPSLGTNTKMHSC